MSYGHYFYTILRYILCMIYIFMNYGHFFCEKKKVFSHPLRFHEYIKLDRDKSTFKSHRDFSSEIEITFKHF